MARFDYARMARKTDALIARFGQPLPAKLRRGAVDRDCTAVLVDYKPSERGFREVGAKRALLSTIDPTTKLLIIEPDAELDKFVFNGEINRIIAPVRGPRPGGTIIFYDLEVVYDSREV